MANIKALRELYGPELSDEEVVSKFSEESGLPAMQVAHRVKVDPGGKWSNRGAAAVDSAQAHAWDAAEAASRGLGWDAVADYAGERRKRNEGQAEAETKFSQEQGLNTDFTKIRNPMDVARFVGGTALDSAPEMGTIMAGAGAGAVAGSFIPGIGTAIGAGVGTLAAGIPLYFGANREAQREQTKDSPGGEKVDNQAALMAAVGQSGLDLFGGPVEMLMKKGAIKVGEKFGKKALEEGVETAAGVAGSETKRVGTFKPSALAKDFVTGGAKEAAFSEVPQQVLEEFARGSVDPNASMTSPEAWERYGGAAAGALALGGPLGSVHGAMGRASANRAAGPSIETQGGTDLLTGASSALDKSGAGPDASGPLTPEQLAEGRRRFNMSQMAPGANVEGPITPGQIGLGQERFAQAGGFQPAGPITPEQLASGQRAYQGPEAPPSGPLSPEQIAAGTGAFRHAGGLNLLGEPQEGALTPEQIAQGQSRFAQGGGLGAPAGPITPEQAAGAGPLTPQGPLTPEQAARGRQAFAQAGGLAGQQGALTPAQLAQGKKEWQLQRGLLGTGADLGKTRSEEAEKRATEEAARREKEARARGVVPEGVKDGTKFVNAYADLNDALKEGVISDLQHGVAVSYLKRGQLGEVGRLLKDASKQWEQKQAAAKEKADAQAAADAEAYANPPGPKILERFPNKEGKTIQPGSLAADRLFMLLGLDKDGRPVTGNRLTLNNVGQAEHALRMAADPNYKGKAVGRNAVNNMLAPYGLDEDTLNALHAEIHTVKTSGETERQLGDELSQEHEAEDDVNPASSDEAGHGVEDTGREEMFGETKEEKEAVELDDEGKPIEKEEEDGGSADRDSVTSSGLSFRDRSRSFEVRRALKGMAVDTKTYDEKQRAAFAKLVEMEDDGSLTEDDDPNEPDAENSGPVAYAARKLVKNKTLFPDPGMRAALGVLFEHGKTTIAAATTRSDVESTVAARTGRESEHDRDIRERREQSEKRRADVAFLEAEAKREMAKLEIATGRITPLEAELTSGDSRKQTRMRAYVDTARSQWNNMKDQFSDRPAIYHLPSWDSMLPTEQATWVRMAYENAYEGEGSPAALERSADQIAEAVDARRTQEQANEARSARDTGQAGGNVQPGRTGGNVAAVSEGGTQGAAETTGTPATATATSGQPTGGTGAATTVVRKRRLVPLTPTPEAPATTTAPAAPTEKKKITLKPRAREAGEESVGAATDPNAPFPLTDAQFEKIRPQVARLIELHESGAISDEAMNQRVGMVYADLMREEAASRNTGRGADAIRQGLKEAGERGEMSPEAVALGDWFLSKHPNFAKGLAARFSSEADKDGSLGFYLRVSQIIQLFDGTNARANPGTIVHEIMHHIERMLPQPVRVAITQAWAKGLSRMKMKAEKSGDADLKKYYDLLWDHHMVSGNPDSYTGAIDLIRKGKVDPHLYQWANASEFFAVNGTAIMEGRYEGTQHIASKLLQWFAEFVHFVRDKLGLTSNRSVMLALDGIARGDGAFVNDKMLHQGASMSHRLYTGPGAAGKEKAIQYDRAQRMDDEGYSPGVIRAATGWFVNPHDNKWRYEIGDDMAVFKTPVKDWKTNQTYKLGDVLDHPKLYEAYPEARDIPVVKRWMDGEAGFNPMGGKPGAGFIEMSATHRHNDEKVAKNSLIHEIQHWVQQREGFDPGANMSTVLDAATPAQIQRLRGQVQTYYNDKAKLLEAHAAELDKVAQWDKVDEMAAARREDDGQWKDIVIRKEKLREQGLSTAEIDDDPRMKELTKEWVKERDAYTKLKSDMAREVFGLNDTVFTNLVHHKMDSAALSRIESALEFGKLGLTFAAEKMRIDAKESRETGQEALTSTDAEFRAEIRKTPVLHKAYMAVSGEMEARDAADRADLTDAQRKANLPYVTPTVAGIEPEDVIRRERVILETPSASQTEASSMYREDPMALSDHEMNIQERVKAMRAQREAALEKQNKVDMKSRRNFLLGMAGVSATVGTVGYTGRDQTTIGKAKPISEAVLDSKVSDQVQRLLRGTTKKGATNPNGLTNLRAALAQMEKDKPELAALIKRVREFLPESGLALTIEEDGEWNAHGAVVLGDKPELKLMVAGRMHGFTYGTILHELLHAGVGARYHQLSIGATYDNYDKVNTPSPKSMPALRDFARMWADFKDSVSNREFKLLDDRTKTAVSEAFNNPDEFFVRALTDPHLQEWMSKREYRGKTLLERFKDWVTTSLFGLSAKGVRPSWLDAALEASHQVTESGKMDPADWGFHKKTRQASVDNPMLPHGGLSVLRSAAPESAPTLRVEAREESVTSVAQRVMTRVPDRAKPTVDTMGKIVANSAKKLVRGFTFTHDLLNQAVAGMPSATRYDRLQEVRNAAKLAQLHAADTIVSAFKNLNENERASVQSYLKKTTTENKWGFVPEWLPVNAETPAVKEDGPMKAAYKALTDPAKRTVEAMLKHGHTTLTEMKALVNNNVSAEFDAAIMEALARGDKTTAHKLADEKDSQLKNFTSLLSIGERNPYVPLKRFGNHVVVGKSAAYADAEQLVKDNPGNGPMATRLREMQRQPAHYYVAMRETKHEAQQLAEKISGDYAFADAMTKDGNNYFAQLGGNRGMLGMFHRLRAQADREGVDQKARIAGDRMMTDLYLSLLSETSARQAERERRNVAGADEDMVRAFHSKARADANFLAALKTGGDIQNALSAMESEAKRNGVQNGTTRGEREDMYREILSRHIQDMDYKQSPFVDAGLKIASNLQTITNPAYHLTNFLQPYVMSAPNMAGRFGMYRSLVALASAHRELGKLMFKDGVNHTSINDMPADIREGIRTLMNMGRINMSLDTEHGSTWNISNDKFSKIVNLPKTVSERIEAMNRVATAAAALRLATKSGMSQESAVAYAAKIIYDTHGDYSGYNTPSMMRGPTARLAMQYRKFQLIQISNYVRMMGDAFFNANLSSEEKWVARKMMAYNLSTMFALGGTLALPGAQFIAVMLRGIFGDDRDPDDPETTMRKFIGDEDLANLLVKGVPAWLGVDVSGRLGAGSMLSLFPYADTSKGLVSKEAFGEYAKAAAGPFLGGVLPKLAEGMKNVFSGDVYKGLENLMPNGIGNILQASRITTEGVTMKNGDTVMQPEEIGALATISKGLGVPTTTVTNRQYRSNAAYVAAQFYKDQSSAVKRAYVEAYRAGDSDAISAARQDWMDLNASRTANNLKATPLSELIKAPHEQAKREKSAVGGVETTKRTKGYIQMLDEVS
jgi:hypothetical protein